MFFRYQIVFSANGFRSLPDVRINTHTIFRADDNDVHSAASRGIGVNNPLATIIITVTNE